MDVTSATAQASRAQSSAATLSGNFDTFLTLLTAQLQNQDPLEPMDSNEFTQQLVQFSSVEQAIHTNENLETLINLTVAGASGNTVSYLGKTATVSSTVAHLTDGEATWNYELPREAVTATLKVADSTGRIVYTTTGEVTAGQHSFTWDGESTTGVSMPEGDYTLSVTATDTAGATMNPTITIKGRVTSIDFSGASPLLTIGGTQVGLGSIIALETTEAN